jgi:hypothetical protein
VNSFGSTWPPSAESRTPPDEDAVIAPNRAPCIEGLLLFSHLAIFLGCVFTMLSPVKAIAFVLVQQAVLGVYFGMLFALNHKGMPMRTDEESLEWLASAFRSRSLPPERRADLCSTDPHE